MKLVHSNVWVCNCFNGLGFIIPDTFSMCSQCKSKQKFHSKREHFFRLFTPRIHAITLSHYFGVYEKANNRAIEKTTKKDN